MKKQLSKVAVGSGSFFSAELYQGKIYHFKKIIKKINVSFKSAKLHIFCIHINTGTLTFTQADISSILMAECLRNDLISHHILQMKGYPLLCRMRSEGTAGKSQAEL